MFAQNGMHTMNWIAWKTKLTYLIMIGILFLLISAIITVIILFYVDQIMVSSLLNKNQL